MTPAEAELNRATKMFAQKVDRLRKSSEKAMKAMKEVQHDLINILAAVDDLEEAKEHPTE